MKFCAAALSVLVLLLVDVDAAPSGVKASQLVDRLKQLLRQRKNGPTAARVRCRHMPSTPPVFLSLAQSAVSLYLVASSCARHVIFIRCFTSLITRNFLVFSPPPSNHPPLLQTHPTLYLFNFRNSEDFSRHKLVSFQVFAKRSKSHVTRPMAFHSGTS